MRKYIFVSKRFSYYQDISFFRQSCNNRNSVIRWWSQACKSMKILLCSWKVPLGLFSLDFFLRNFNELPKLAAKGSKGMILFSISNRNPTFWTETCWNRLNKAFYLHWVSQFRSPFSFINFVVRFLTLCVPQTT